jgi:hypothetical protein
LICILTRFVRYTTQAVTAAILLLASTCTTDAAPLLPRDATLSPSFATLAKPIFAPYYVYFGNMKVTLSGAFDSLGMKAATVGFASAPKGQVSAFSLAFNTLLSFY